VERAPAAAELYARGAHDAPGTFEIGDPRLKLERARSLELGLRRSEGPLRVDASAYYTRYTGFIYRRLTGVSCGDEFDTCGVDNELKQIVYSQQNAKFYGVDLSAQYNAFTYNDSVFGVTGQYDFVRAKFDDGTNVPRIPPHRVGAGLFWRDTSGWFAKVSLLHAFAHTETAQFETRTSGYNLLNAELSYTHKMDKKIAGITDVTVGVTGTNLLDAKIRNSTSFKKDEILLQDRGARGFVNVRF
jgi:iron complex outermembrane recepter protein